MFTIVPNVKVDKPYYRLKKTGAKGRNLKGPVIFEDGLVDIFTVAVNGVIGTGFIHKGHAVLCCLTKDGTSYYCDYGDVIPDNLLDISNVISAEEAISNSRTTCEAVAPLEVVEAGFDMLYGIIYQHFKINYGTLPNHVSGTDRAKYLGDLSKPIWRKSCQLSSLTHALNAAC